MSDREGDSLDVGDGDDVVDVSLSNDGPAESGAGSRAVNPNPYDDEVADVENGYNGSDKALLMGAAPGAGGFGDGAIVNWHSFARPFEAGVLGVVALMLSFGLGGGDWLHGTNGDLAHVFAGLKSASVGNATGRLSEACHPEEPGDAVTCSVASAGGWGAAFLTLALLACVLLIVRLVLEELYTRGMLAVALARLNEKVPLQTLAPLRTLGPAISWGALVCFQYLGLLVYAAKAPATLGAGAAALGVSYGLVRLATVASALGATAHYAASRAVEDSLLLETLDSVKNGLTGLERRPRMLQVRPSLTFTGYCHGVWLTNGGSGRSRLLRNGRAIVLQWISFAGGGGGGKGMRAPHIVALRGKKIF